MPVRTQLGSIPLVTVSNRLLAKGHEMAATMLHTREYGMTSHPLGHRRRRESHLIYGSNPFGRNDGDETRPRVVRMPVGIDESIGSVGFVNRSIHPLYLGHMQRRDPAQYQSQREDKQMFHKTFHIANIHKKRELRQIPALFFHDTPPPLPLFPCSWKRTAAHHEWGDRAPTIPISCDCTAPGGAVILQRINNCKFFQRESDYGESKMGNAPVSMCI